MKYEERERILGRGIIRGIETEGGTQRLMDKERIKEKKNRVAERIRTSEKERND